MTNTATEDTLMRIPEVSAMSGVPAETLRYMRKTKQGPVSGVLAGRVVYRKSDVLAWIDSAFDQEPA